MKTIFFTAVLFSIVSCKNDKSKILRSQSASTDTAIIKRDLPTTDITDSIKNEYTILQAQLTAKKLQSSRFTYNCYEEPSGEVTFYSDQSGVRVIEHMYAEHSHFSAVERYFISGGKPFFIFKEETVWNFDGGTPEKPITKDDITETRMYLQQGLPVKCLEKKYNIRSDQKAENATDKIPNKEISCNGEEILTTFRSLLQHKDQKGEIKCL
ncbi:hypothetical protein [Chryseobacterium sp. 22458]|uniref:hypothetical protein n=1 Tax=Chryseobacterium sp. 22458 TaxID=3453921 RepID=UPI003F862E62